MIRVRHNDAERVLDPDGYGNLGDAIAACMAESGDSAQVVERLQVNGCVIPEPSLEALHDLPLDGVTEIELESRSPRSVALASLDSSAGYLTRVREALDRAAALLRSGDVAAANRLYADILDALGVLVFSLGAAAATLGKDGEPLGSVGAEASPLLSSLVEAQGRRDWVRVADSLEHEVSPLLESWSRRVRDVRRAREAEGDRLEPTH